MQKCSCKTGDKCTSKTLPELVYNNFDFTNEIGERIEIYIYNINDYI